jgi:5'-nucleotidase (lipoprotein e(P4) family)
MPMSVSSVVRVLAWAGLSALLAAGCATTRPDRAPRSQARADSLARVADSLEAAVATWKERARLRHPTLDATLWAQTAVEYDGVTRGAYRLAGAMMESALADSTWTAALTQARQAPAQYRDKPPAVVLDVDETVLDNSAYQARLIRENETYASESWHAWCREEQAGAVPGALDFTRRADSMGVQVIYLTNRDSTVEAATRDNLRKLGFPVEDAPDAVLTQGEKPGWEPKAPRREWVAERYRVLLLVGDNLGDFAAPVDTSLAVRRSVADRYERFWGTRWIALPNPQYGSWEGALFNYDYGQSAWEQLRRKHEQLETKEP